MLNSFGNTDGYLSLPIAFIQRKINFSYRYNKKYFCNWKGGRYWPKLGSSLSTKTGRLGHSLRWLTKKMAPKSLRKPHLGLKAEWINFPRRYWNLDGEFTALSQRWIRLAGLFWQLEIWRCSDSYLTMDRQHKPLFCNDNWFTIVLLTKEPFWTRASLLSFLVWDHFAILQDLLLIVVFSFLFLPLDTFTSTFT